MLTATSRHHHATASLAESGAVFTKRCVAEFILDLVGYTGDKPLTTKRLLEPSCGHGDFLIPTIERLLQARERLKIPYKSLRDCIVGIDVNQEAYQHSRSMVIDLLRDSGASPEESLLLADAWLHHADFLFTSLSSQFDVVVGNPPYVRQERVPDELLAAYRSRFPSMYGRADVYIAFYEQGLRSLALSGKLGFICADRWTKNQYGSRLRNLISQEFHLSHFVDMVNTPAFTQHVIAYPAVTVIERASGELTRVTAKPDIDPAHLRSLAADLVSTTPPSTAPIYELARVVNQSEPWMLHDANAIALTRKLEALFPAIEASGCNIGIGVATGCDEAYIAKFDEMDVEASRKLPLVMTKDIATGSLNWQGKGVLNPFLSDGKLAPLTDHPRMHAYLMTREDRVKKRHIAQRNPRHWYRTIDRIDSRLAAAPKLLIPDIKGRAHIVFDQGLYYPHHNLYYITTSDWEIEALRRVLLHGLAHLFVSAYSTTMHGGCLRFQAQYLRRIRLPQWNQITRADQKALSSGNDKSAHGEFRTAFRRVFGLSTNEETQLLTPQ